MKKILCILLGLMLASGFARGESTPAPEIQLPLLTVSAAPAASIFSSEDLIVTLPAGMEILSADELAGYEAALQADYPDAARVVFAAVNADRSAALSFSIASSNESALAAAQQASTSIPNSTPAAEHGFGENNCAAFSYTLDEQASSLYFISKDGQLLIIGASGIDEEEIETMIAGLIF